MEARHDSRDVGWQDGAKNCEAFGATFGKMSPRVYSQRFVLVCYLLHRATLSSILAHAAALETSSVLWSALVSIAYAQN